MKIAKPLQVVTAFVVALLCVTIGWAQPKKPRVLMLVTSADKFADGRLTGLWLEEFAVPYQVLMEGGATVTVVSPKGGATPIDPRSNPTPEQAAAWANAEKVLHSTQPLSPAIWESDFDALFIPGGHGPMIDLARDQQVAKLASDFARSGKLIAAVCHGPAALVGATRADGTPLVRGKRLTSFSDSEEKAVGLQNAVPFWLEQRLIGLGAHFTQGKDFSEYAVEDGNLITGQNPQSSAKAAQLLLARLAKSETHSSN